MADSNGERSIVIAASKEDVGAHCTGQNSISIGIYSIGDLSKDGMPLDLQIEALSEARHSLFEQLKEKLSRVTLHGHNEFVHKACLCFKMPDDL